MNQKIEEVFKKKEIELTDAKYDIKEFTSKDDKLHYMIYLKNGDTEQVGIVKQSPPTEPDVRLIRGDVNTVVAYIEQNF